jgi:hypothetical protein
METQTVTIQIDVSTAAILRALQKRAAAEGVTLDVLLRPLVEDVDLCQTEPQQDQGRTWADVWAELDAMPSDENYPPDLLTNKKYMEGYGER